MLHKEEEKKFMAQSPGEGCCENLKLAKLRFWKGQSWNGLLEL